MQKYKVDKKVVTDAITSKCNNEDKALKKKLPVTSPYAPEDASTSNVPKFVPNNVIEESDEHEPRFSL